jgi:hypothetical protein
MYSVGQTFFHNLYNLEFVIKQVYDQYKMYRCETINPNKDEHGMDIGLTVYVSGDYISKHLDIK